MTFLSYLRHTLIANRGMGSVSLKEHRALYREWQDMNDTGKTPLELEMPWITLIARDYLKKYLNQRSKASTRIFEYGSGGSSAFFLKFASEVVSVEHDKQWADRVRNWAAQQKITGWTLEFIAPEWEPAASAVCDPSDPLLYQSDGDTFSGYVFRRYASLIDRFSDQYFDVVLVDGRSRPSCIAHSCPKVKQGGLLVLDNAERAYYLKKAKSLEKDFILLSSDWGALIGSPQFTRTNIYLRK